MKNKINRKEYMKNLRRNIVYKTIQDDINRILSKNASFLRENNIDIEKLYIKDKKLSKQLRDTNLPKV